MKQYYWCSNCALFNSDLSSWDVSNVNDLVLMFKECHMFTRDLSQWNVGNVINMTEMFRGCKRFVSILADWDLRSLEYSDDIYKDALINTVDPYPDDIDCSYRE